MSVKETNTDSNVIEVDSATPDFERASQIFTETIGVRIDEACVRKLWASCFVPKQLNAIKVNMTGKELVVQRNPAEISDLTEKGNEESGDVSRIPVRHPIQDDRATRVIRSENVNKETQLIEMARKNSTPKEISPSNGGAISTNASVPLGVAACEIEENHNEEIAEHESIDSESIDVSQPLFEDVANAINRDNTVAMQKMSETRKDFEQESGDSIVMAMGTTDGHAGKDRERNSDTQDNTNLSKTARSNGKNVQDQESLVTQVQESGDCALTTQNRNSQGQTTLLSKEVQESGGCALTTQNRNSQGQTTLLSKESAHRQDSLDTQRNESSDVALRNKKEKLQVQAMLVDGQSQLDERLNTVLPLEHENVQEQTRTENTRDSSKGAREVDVGKVRIL